MPRVKMRLLTCTAIGIRRPGTRWLRHRATILWAVMAACNSPTETWKSDEIVGTQPRQLITIGAPEVLRVVPDSAFLLFAVTAPDSTFHIAWRPTELLVETDRGYSETVLLPPHRCLLPQSTSSLGFPFNFTWWSCSAVGINTTVILSGSRLQVLERLVSGVRTHARAFLTQPGAQYQFRVPVGLEATEEAVARLATQPEVTDPFRVNFEPLCYISDVEPRPACEPWWLQARRWFTFGAARGDTLPVSVGGWVRASYTQADGARRITTFTFEE